MPTKKQIRRATRQREIAFELEIERPGPDGREWMEVEIRARGNAGHDSPETGQQDSIDPEIEILTVRAQDPNGKPIARHPWQRPSVPYDVPIELTAAEMAQAEELGLERLALEASEDDDEPDRYDD